MDRFGMLSAGTEETQENGGRSFSRAGNRNINLQRISEKRRCSGQTLRSEYVGETVGFETAGLFFPFRAYRSILCGGDGFASGESAKMASGAPSCLPDFFFQIISVRSFPVGYCRRHSGGNLQRISGVWMCVVFGKSTYNTLKAFGFTFLSADGMLNLKMSKRSEKKI